MLKFVFHLYAVNVYSLNFMRILTKSTEKLIHSSMDDFQYSEGQNVLS